MADVMLVDDTEKRLRSHKGVVGFMVINGDGIPIRSTLDQAQTVQYAALVSRFVEKCHTCTKKLCADDELHMVRIRSAKHEIIVASDYSSGEEPLTMIVVQDPSEQKLP